MSVVAGVSAGIALGKSLMELAGEIGKAVDKANESPIVIARVLLYLEAAQAAVELLGKERQRILTKVRKCDIGDSEQTKALWEQLDVYLKEDNVRPQLQRSIDGLKGCRGAIEKEAQPSWFRIRDINDKQTAVENFSITLEKLTSTLDSLNSDFYPGGGSGMGIVTLVPIGDFLRRVLDEKQLRVFTDSENQAATQELGELARAALRNPSHTEWIRVTGEVETLVAQLQLAFSVRIEKETNDS